MDYNKERKDKISRDSGGVHAGHRARLRESAKNDCDLSSLSDVELVELLLSFLIPQKDTNVLAHKLIDRYGSVAGVMCARQDELVEFPHVTAHVAAVLPALFGLCLVSNGKILKLKDRAQAADFFGLANLGKSDVGTYVMFMDSELNVRTIEFFAASGVPMRDILGSACKHQCKYVFIARREPDLFPQMFNVAEEVGALAGMLLDMNVTMLDYIIFSDYGYYTVGTPPKSAGWYPMYIFVPAIGNIGTKDVYGAVISGGGLYAGRETAEQPEDFAMQLCAAVKDGTGV